MDVLLARHGQSQDLADGTRSRPNTPLTKVGRDQAADAARLLQRHGILPTLIITSAMTRAIQTGEEIIGVLGYGGPVEQWDILNERNCGEAEGLREDEWPRRWPSFDVTPGAETMAELQERVNAAWEKIMGLELVLPHNAVVLVVSHRTFGRAIVRAIEGRPYTDDATDHERSLEPGQVLQLYPNMQLLG